MIELFSTKIDLLDVQVDRHEEVFRFPLCPRDRSKLESAMPASRSSLARSAICARARLRLRGRSGSSLLG